MISLQRLLPTTFTLSGVIAVMVLGNAPANTVIVFVAGVLSSTLGALIPAARAALMHPVRALRFE
ncbi:MAG: hypothetical protein WCI61_02520 [Chloroflexota bacterium]